MRVAALFLLLAFATGARCQAGTIVFVPLDDRPVTRQLPKMLAQIAGEQVVMPPRALLGRYLEPGDADAIGAWLESPATDGADAAVLSTDMLAYGGLVASRTPYTSLTTALERLRVLERLRANRPQLWIGAFGTIMRLAPTGVPAIGAAKDFFAAGPAVGYLQEYANLHDPPTAAERPSAAQLRALIGEPTFSAYLRTRERDRQVDLFILHMVADGTLDRVVLGQDDAGPVGLHLVDVAALRSAVAQEHIGDRSAIEPGADELGMALVARALLRAGSWAPSVRVHYSRADGAAVNDPLEFAPIDVTVRSLIALCGAYRDDVRGEIQLYVRVPQTTAADDRLLVESLAADVAAGRSVAFADVSFLTNSFAEQQSFAGQMIAAGLAGKIDAYASWNTAANTIGTALAEAIAAGVGRRSGRYDPIAHAQFMLDRYADDIAFHVVVRPQLIAELKSAGVQDHTYLLPSVAVQADRRNRELLWRQALGLLRDIYPQYRDAGLTITLPWDRTFETEIDVRLF